MVIYILLYFAIGALIACFNCAIQGTPNPPDMSDEDKNTFALIVAFWAMLIPVKFAKRLYKAIKGLLVKDKNDQL